MTVGEQFIIAGGVSSNGSALTDVWASPDGIQWSLRASSVPALDRLGACTFEAGSAQVLVAGGMKRLVGSSVQYLNDVWRSSDGFTWEEVTNGSSSAWSGRAGQGCIQMIATFVLLGGASPAPSADMFASSDGETWVHMGVAPWAPRGYFSLATFVGRLFMAGGTDFSRSFNDVWTSPDGVSSWVLVSTAPWPARSSACLINLHGVLWLLGGRLAANATAAAAAAAMRLNAELEHEVVGQPVEAHRALAAAAGARLLPGRLPLGGQRADAGAGAGAGALAATLPAGVSAAASDPASASSDVWRSDGTGRGWELVDGHAPWGPREGFGCAVLPGSSSIYTFGGLAVQTAPQPLGPGPAPGGATPEPEPEPAPEGGDSTTTTSTGGKSGSGSDSNGSGGGGGGGGGGQPILVASNDVWSSTGNLLCEDGGIVCSGHGTCSVSGLLSSLNPDQSSAASASASASAGEWLMTAQADPNRNRNPSASTLPLPSVPPLPINCSCSAGFIGPRCGELFCSPKTCIHGTCQAVNASSFALGQAFAADTRQEKQGPSSGDPSGAGDAGQVCVCSDPSQWTGPNCDTAVCLAGCSPDHGSCAGAPGTCTCDSGWLGSTCAVELTPLRSVGLWVERHVAQVYVSITLAGGLVAAAVVLVTNAVASGSALAGGIGAAAAAAGKPRQPGMRAGSGRHNGASGSLSGASAPLLLGGRGQGYGSPAPPVYVYGAAMPGSGGGLSMRAQATTLAAASPSPSSASSFSPSSSFSSSLPPPSPAPAARLGVRFAGSDDDGEDAR